MASLTRPFRRLRPAHWIVIDCALTALMAFAYIRLTVEPLLRWLPLWAALLIVASAVLPAAFRRRWPLGVLTLVLAAGAVAAAMIPSPFPCPPLAAAYAIYVIPLRFPQRDALWLLAGSLLTVAAGLAGFAFIPHEGFGAGGIGKASGLLLESALLITVAWLAGYSMRQHRARAADQREQAERKAREQREQAERRAREQLAEAARTRSEERLQIARELHDVVAHTLSVIAVQAGVANYVISAHPEEAARALSSIEQTSRSALHEMRALLGVFRAKETEASNGTAQGTRVAARMPTPGLADLDSLVERAGEAGVQVDLSVRGERPRLPAGLDLAAYRVIQEAVTNVIKHAATDRCLVTVAHQEDTLTLEVTDDGRGSHAGGDGGETPAAGHGIVGMRERVAIYGGEMCAVPLPERGFRVTARFPVASTGPATDTEPAETRA